MPAAAGEVDRRRTVNDDKALLTTSNLFHGDAVLSICRRLTAPAPAPGGGRDDVSWRDIHRSIARRVCTHSRTADVTTISANADGPRDGASRKINHIALPTEYNYQATSVGR